MKDHSKNAYITRFSKACSFIDEFIVHTKISKDDVVQTFDLPAERVHICCHGVFVPKSVIPFHSERTEGRLRVLMFGNQSYYKGTDILVDAVCKLNEEQNERIEVQIIGSIEKSYLKELQDKDINNRINWTPYFLDDIDLYEAINKCDLLVLPYRAISQSGVLLLSIYFGKLIICSDLPSFVETMRGNFGDDLDDSLFFHNGDSDSLKDLLVRYANKEIDEAANRNRIRLLKNLYSWESAARSTLEIYKK